ncbi:bifunctional oligoribonuclease/PAP phosphatase NrnA [Parablautia intestinalis]|uniref:Bifunctional oligoribonuclease/PAP phosphatase NrnA n=1 Tax=Parablautia intestinalis TaxID=2320100 RepID=A0A3A9AQ71_9FIRM|nr:bifunctional oligoribonuclease/PAP phosphatase NrnA [Parablautia intestinalis]RKI93557.1 bifunctional oligoribonuclease/PAP phosphatase NrnA [Parablautia intestinalis]
MNIFEEVKGAGSIGISGHIRPDGDCVGAVMGLYLFLKKVCPGAKVQVLLEKPADIFSCIKDVEEIHTDFTTDIACFDVFFALDTSKDRMGEAEKYFDSAKKKINIDHHISNKGCGDVNDIVPDASSASELVYNAISDKSLLDKEIAKALYIGIIHDTGVFQYSNTSPATLKAAADLISYGFDFPRLIDETFYEKTYVQNQILGRALLESIMFMDGRCVVSMIDRKTMKFYRARPEDLDGIVNQLRNTKGVECAIFMYQTDTLEYKVSLRSNGKVDVAKVAGFFGGGGHVRAAGVTMQGTFYDIINNLSARIEMQLKDKK